MELIEREAAIDTLEKHGVVTDFGYAAGDVTHWMPLPEPPEANP